MEGYRLRSAHGDTIDPRQPLPVDSVEAQAVESVTPTITYNGKAAAGAVSVNSLTYKPIISIEGDQVASYWGEEQNKVYEAFNTTNKKKGAHWLTSFTETATAAAIVIYDPDHNLENMFESVTGTTKRYIVKAIDTTGHVLYGWIRGVSVSGNLYTFEVFNTKTTEAAQSWVGNTTDFVQTSLEKIEIYHFNSSLTFNTGTILTEEVACPKEYSKNWENPILFANSLSNGQYFVDYMRARIIGKKAATTASETVTYNIWSSTTGTTGGAAGSVTVTSIVPGTGATNLGKAEDAAHTSGDTGVMALGVGNVAQTTLAADGDYIPLAVDTKGNRMSVGNVASGATDAGNPIKVGGVFNTTPAALTTGQRGDMQLDANQNVRTAEQYVTQADDQVFHVLKTQMQGRYTVPLTASALVATGAGQLMGFVVNSCAATATLKIWDNTSAATTVIFDTMTFTTAVAEGPKVFMLPAAVKFTTGCYFTIAVAAMSVTPIWNQ